MFENKTLLIIVSLKSAIMCHHVDVSILKQ